VTISSRRKGGKGPETAIPLEERSGFSASREGRLPSRSQIHSLEKEREVGDSPSRKEKRVFLSTFHPFLFGKMGRGRGRISINE